MKKIVIFYLSIICISLMLCVGCTGSTSQKAPADTPTPQIVYVTVTVTPTYEIPETKSPSVINPTTTALKGPKIPPKYIVGDIIADKGDTTFSKGKWVVLEFDPDLDQYGISLIFKKSDDTWGVRINSTVVNIDRDKIERYLPDKIGNLQLSKIIIDPDTFTNIENSEYLVRKALNDVNSDLRFNVMKDLITDGKKLMDAADSEYQKYSMQDEYAKYLLQVSKFGKDLNGWGTAYSEKQKAAALSYADYSSADVKEIQITLRKMKYSDRYGLFSDIFLNDVSIYDEINTGIIDSREHTDVFL